jgi:type I restriction enzyme S subunit
MSDRLPSDWVRVEIGSICKLINGRAFKPSEWSDSGIPIVRIQNLRNPNARFNYFSGEVLEKHKINSGALLFAWSGTPGTSFGAHIWEGGPAVLNQHIFRIDVDERYINKKYLRVAINEQLTELIESANGGVGLQHITKGVFERTKVPLPPKSEQDRIVEKVEQASAVQANIRESLQNVRVLQREAS